MITKPEVLEFPLEEEFPCLASDGLKYLLHFASVISVGIAELVKI